MSFFDTMSHDEYMKRVYGITPGGYVLEAATQAYTAQKAQQDRQRANDVQIAGDHYKQFKGHEPWDVVTAWGLGYLDGTALKYISRWKHKGGVEDIKKAIHFLQKLLEVEEDKNKNGLYRTTGNIKAGG